MGASAGGYLGRYGVVGAIILAVLGGVLLNGMGGKEGPGDTSKLPFNGQFPVAKLNSVEFETKIGMPPNIHPTQRRDYAVYVLMNTLDGSLNCPICKTMEREFSTIAALIGAEQRISKKVHFVSLELAENRATFIKAKIDQVPMLFYLPPMGNGYSMDEYEKQIKLYDIKQGPLPHLIAQFIEHHSDITIKESIKPRIGMIMFSLGAVLVLASLVKLFFKDVVARTLFSHRLWAMLGVVFMVTMTSGYMWVKIRSAPYTVQQRDGFHYFAPGIQSMLGIEAQLVGLFNCIGAISMIALATRIPKMNNAMYRRIAVIACTTLFMMSFSAEIALFRRKIAAYPFRLLFA